MKSIDKGLIEKKPLGQKSPRSETTGSRPVQKKESVKGHNGRSHKLG